MAGGIDAYTVLMLHCDGADTSTTFADASYAGANSPHTMTANGNAQVDTAQSKFDGASYLGDGSGDYLSTPNSTDWNLGGTGAGNDWTIDGWFRHATTSTDGLFTTYNASVGWQVYYEAGGPYLAFSRSTGTVPGPSFSMNQDQWYHIAFVKSGTTITHYIDGTSIGTMTDFNMDNGGHEFDLGCNNVGGGDSWQGWIDEFRISKGIARWTSNFTPESAAYSIGTPNLGCWFRGLPIPDRTMGILM